MSSDGTHPVRQVGSPVRAIAVEVVRGPDRGLTTTSLDAVSIGTAEGNTLVLTDRTVSRFHVVLERIGARIRVVDRGATNGVEIGGARLDGGSFTVRPGAVIDLGETSVRIADGHVTMTETGPDRLHELRGQSEPMRRLMATIETLRSSDVSVLIAGESGTGKELVARAVHATSKRAEEPFVTVDCAALTPSLVTSELFGHERGSFTGADRQHIGAFERASGGTLFLDEVGELSPEHQATLLGALERRRIRRIGGTSEVPVDVRVLSATHRDLFGAVNRGTFRLDLFYRLAVVTLHTPSLRERSEDIPMLVEHFLVEAGVAGRLAELFPPAELAALRARPFFGNVRELRNVVLATLALGRAPEPPPARADVETAGDDASLTYKEARRLVLERFERRYLSALLARCEGSVRRASREGDLDRSHLTELIRKHGLK